MSSLQPAPAPTPQPTQTTGMGTVETGELHETDPHANTPRTTANLEATATGKYLTVVIYNVSRAVIMHEVYNSKQLIFLPNDCY